MTASLQDAQHVLSAALAAGFRESGAVSLEGLPIVAVRSSGLMLDSIIGCEPENGEPISIVDEAHLVSLVQIANERFQINAQRRERFKAALLRRYHLDPEGSSTLTDSLTETAEQRRARKKQEGLLRQQAMRQTRPERSSNDDDILEPFDNELLS